MIRVVAPDGHAVGDSVASSEGFDDMDLDALLENQPASKPAPEKIPTPKPANPRAVDRRPVAAAKTELRPGEDWTNPATKKKQKAVLIVMAAIGSVFLLAAIGFFLLSQSDPGEVVAGNKPAVEDPQPNNDPAEVKVPEPELGETETDPVIDDNELPEETDPDPTIPTVPELPPSIPGLEAETPASGKKDPVPVEPKKTEPDPPVAESKDESATVRSILAESGTSVLKLQNAASRVRGDFGIGAQKYLFEKLPQQPIDFTRRKDQKLLGVSYDKQSLQTVLHELASISGLQLMIDAPEIALSGKELNPPVTFQVENDSTATVIRKVAQSVGLVAIETDEGFKVTVPQDEKPVQQSIDVALLVENDQDRAMLAKHVQQLVWPGTWLIDGDVDDKKGSCEFKDGNLEIQHAQVVIDEVQRLVDGLKAAARNDLQGSELLQPVPWIDQGAFAKPFQGKNSVRGSVGSFFRSLNKDYQIQMMADWQSLGETGWTSDAMAASWIKEKTVGDVVRETAHAFGSGVYVIDERTVWLTPTKVASDIFELKLYPVTEIISEKLSPERISKLLAEVLGDQAFRSGVSFAYFPSQKTMALRAPQTLHRQVEAVFDELR